MVFSTILLAGVAILVVPCSANRLTRQTADTECSPSASYDVVIVGAGMAGLSAAVELYTKRHIKNITILEARDRIGGRIHTIRHNGSTNFEEYGAQWVHGDHGHEMMTYIKRNNLFVPKNQKPNGDDSWYNMNGVEIPDDVVVSVENQFDAIRESFSDGSSDALNRSLGDLTKEKIASWLRSHPGNTDAKQAVFNLFYNDRCTDNSEDLMKISTIEESEYEEVPGDLESYIKNGYFTLLDRMTANMPLSSILQFKAVVKKINYDVSCNGGPKKVAVYLTDGRVISAKTVIVTLPLGVLKAGSVEFTPALPAAKQTAIKRIGFGCSNKVFLFYRSRWWEESSEMNPVYLDSIPDGINVQSSLYANAEEAKWYRTLDGFNVENGNNLMLQSWLYGDWAKLVERLPLQEVTSVIGQVFTKAFGNDYTVEQPYQVVKTDWCNDPYAMGGYPYAALGARVSDFAAMARPVGSNLFFAGDATSNIHWATVHAAWSSGVRAANEVIRAFARRAL